MSGKRNRDDDDNDYDNDNGHDDNDQHTNDDNNDGDDAKDATDDGNANGDDEAADGNEDNDGNDDTKPSSAPASSIIKKAPPRGTITTTSTKAPSSSLLLAGKPSLLGKSSNGSGVTPMVPAKKASAGSGVLAAKSPAKSNNRANSSAPKGDKADKKPTKPGGAFQQYKQEKLQGKKDEDPDKKLKEINAELKSDWEELDLDEKQKFEKKAKSVMEQWKRDMSKWQAAHPNYLEEEKKEKEEKQKKKEAKAAEKGKKAKSKGSKSSGGEKASKRQKKEKEDGEPKRPMSAAFLYMQEKRKKLKSDEGVVGAEASKQVGALWKATSDEEKEPYNQQAKVLKTKYDKDMAAFKKNKVDPNQRKLATVTVTADGDDDEATDNGANGDEDNGGEEADDQTIAPAYL